MTQDLVSSVPGVFGALLALIETAAAQQKPPVNVFPFEIGQYEPGSYITVEKVAGPNGSGPGPVYEWESLGSFTQNELYSICGTVTVFSGDSVAPGSTVVMDVLAQTFALFQACVMTPAISNRDMPIFGTTGPSPLYVLPGPTNYTGEPGIIAGKPAGWLGEYKWAFKFKAQLTPA